MSLEIKRLHLASLSGVDGRQWPVHGFVVTHPGGAVLVDTGAGGRDELSDWRVVNRSVADALAELDMTPGDIGLVINTHLHFGHCGQNAVFSHAAACVQRAELARAQRESPELYDWFGFMNARFELLDGDSEVLPGLTVIATPGHTVGHQCVIVQSAAGAPDLLIGDAAYTPRQYLGVGRSGPAARPGQRPGGVVGFAAADPVHRRCPGALLPSHRRHSRLRRARAAFAIRVAHHMRQAPGSPRSNRQGPGSPWLRCSENEMPYPNHAQRGIRQRCEDYRQQFLCQPIANQVERRHCILVLKYFEIGII